MKSLYDNTGYKNPWVQNVENILNNCGLSNIWQSQNISFSKKWLTAKVKQIHKDQFLQKWSSQLEDSNISINYRLFKKDFKFEPYLIKLPYKFRLAFCRFRLGNHRLPIERGRYQNVPRADRFCTLCLDTSSVGDEFHFMFECPSLNDLRMKYIPSYFRVRPNTFKFSELFNSHSSSISINTVKFIQEGLLRFK